MANEKEHGNGDDNKDQQTEKTICPEDWEPQKKTNYTLPPGSAANSPKKHGDKKKSLTYEEILQQLEEKIKVG